MASSASQQMPIFAEDFEEFTGSELLREDLLLSVSSHEREIIEQTRSTHARDARAIDVEPVLNVVEDIFNRAKSATLAQLLAVGTQDSVNVLVAKMGGGKDTGGKDALLDTIAATIRKICCQFNRKGTGDQTAHDSTMAILEILGSYTWDAKVVIALAAFAVSYGEFRTVMLLRDNIPLARSIAMLKQTPESYQTHGVLRLWFVTIHELTKVMVNLAKCLIKFRLLPSEYIGNTSFDEVPMATYWTIRTIVASGSQIATNFGVGAATSMTEAWDLSSLAYKEISLHDRLVQRLNLCCEFIEEKKREEAFNNVASGVFKSRDNLRRKD